MIVNTIYKITNKINGKIYIGQTWQPLYKRWNQHCSHKECIKIANAIGKYGRESFSIETLVITNTQECANYWETYFINKLDTINTGYNLQTGGQTAYKYSEEVKHKMSLAHKGHKTSEYQKRRTSEVNKGKILSKETKKKISKALKGKKRTYVRVFTKEILINMSKGLARLTGDQALSILNDPRPRKEIAAAYNISYWCVRDIKKKRRYKLLLESAQKKGSK